MGYGRFFPLLESGLRQDRTLPEKPLQLAHQPVPAVDIELGGEAQHLGPDVEEHR